MLLPRNPPPVKEEDPEHLFQEFVHDPQHRQLIAQWIPLAYWEGPKSSFARAFYILWQKYPNRLKFYGDPFFQPGLDTAMALREMALVLDIGSDLSKLDESEESKMKLKKVFSNEMSSETSKPLESFPGIQSLDDQRPPIHRPITLTLSAPTSGPFRTVPSTNLGGNTEPVSFKTIKSPFAYLEWHKEIANEILNGETKPALHSLSVPFSGGGTGGIEDRCQDSASGEELAANTTDVTHSVPKLDASTLVPCPESKEQTASPLTPLEEPVDGGTVDNEVMNLSASEMADEARTVKTIRNILVEVRAADSEKRVENPLVHLLGSPKSARTKKRARFRRN
ncbi:hypothetical protein J3R30DRAFT_3719572 [Lentinula aciculospora]|uniref:Uncharacterized protein n=1 Tax=Lentinula aciculospora TaxID=153920 RepID=A0A9W8ZT48_9AGAR|nr:hypothetical protein J3R30DRAFT_3719572 [Lentinula aciculospora]